MMPTLSVPLALRQPEPPIKVIMDPSNEASLWTMYVAQDGRPYWYNSVSRESTYDKPFCLKTPEERAIPPCSWKEYTVDGKVYYNNGIQSW